MNMQYRCQSCMWSSGEYKHRLCRFMRKLDFAYAKTKAQISCAVTAQLISTFVFAQRIVQFLRYRYPKFQDSSFFLYVNRPVFSHWRSCIRRVILCIHSIDASFPCGPLVIVIRLCSSFIQTFHYKNLPMQ